MSENTNTSQTETPQGEHSPLRFRLKSGQLIPETEYQRRVRQYQEILIEGMTSSQILTLSAAMEARYTSAEQTLQSPLKEAEQILALCVTMDKLCLHFTAWEDARQKDLEWKRSIEAELRKAVQEQTQILQAVKDKLDELLNGNPQGQSEMFNLLLSTLNDLRERIATLENCSPSRTPSERRPPASGKN